MWLHATWMQDWFWCVTSVDNSRVLIWYLRYHRMIAWWIIPTWRWYVCWLGMVNNLKWGGNPPSMRKYYKGSHVQVQYDGLYAPPDGWFSWIEMIWPRFNSQGEWSKPRLAIPSAYDIDIFAPGENLWQWDKMAGILIKHISILGVSNIFPREFLGRNLIWTDWIWFIPRQ